jgi:hypothetical protein
MPVQIRKEATMAAITFDGMDQEERVRQQVKAAVAAYREMLDRFVNEPIRPSALEGEQSAARQPTVTPSPSAQQGSTHRIGRNGAE